jgi:hypothetical protein
MSNETEHYVVTVDVKRSVRTGPDPASRLGRTEVQPKPERVVEDVTHLVFRASTLYAALDKAEAHLALMKPAGDAS